MSHLTYKGGGRCCAAIAGAPKFLTLYDLESSVVMLSEAHVAL